MSNFQIIGLAAMASFPGVALAQETVDTAPAAIVADGGVYAAVSLAPKVNTAAVPAAPTSTTISSDGTTATDIQNQGNEWQIDGGTVAGSNLFHSFDKFSLASGGSAIWTFSFGDPASITNVINRVTGGAPSLIDGTLDSTALPNADFFLINSAGIVMHENARVDVGASAHFSTASELGFSDGAILSAATPTGSTFSMATPDKLGFFGTEAALSVLGGEPRAQSTTGGALHLSGTSLLIEGMVVDAASFTATATGSAQATVGLSPQSWTDAIAYGGDISVDRLDLRLRPMANTTASDTAAVFAGGKVTLNGSSLQEDSATNFGSGSVVIDGDDVSLSDTVIGTIAREEVAGGDITIRGRDSIALLNSALRTETGTLAAAGDIVLIGGDVMVDAASSVISASTPDTLPSNNIHPADLNAVDGRLILQTVFIGSPTGPAGNISITGSAIYLAAKEISSSILNNALAAGTGNNFGTIIVGGEIITLDGTRIAVEVGAGRSGKIIFSADEIVVVDSEITAESDIGGEGDITFDATGYLGFRNSSISANSFEGRAGNVVLVADRVFIDQTLISTNASGGVGLAAIAGSISINARDVNLQESGLFSRGLGSLQRGGTQGGDIVLEITNTATISNTTISSSAPFGGTGGEIVISARKLTVEADSQLTTSAEGLGLESVIPDATAGNIILQAESITIGDEVIITSEGDLSADGGNITLLAIEMLQIGKDALVSSTILRSFEIDLSQGNLDDFPATAGEIVLQGRLVQIDGATIASTVSKLAAGTSGSVTIKGEKIELTDAATVTAANLGPNSGADTSGSVRLSGSFIDLRNGSAISTNSANGPAGDIVLTLPNDGILRLVGGDNGSSVITTSSGPGTGGVIAIAQPLAIISQGGDILALGDAGGANVRIIADFYINSADTLDRIEVDGDLTFEGDLDFTAMGEEQRDPELLDAGAILSGRCLAAFASGETSQLSIISPGPYGLPLGEAAQSDTIDELAMDARAGRSCG